MRRMFFLILIREIALMNQTLTVSWSVSYLMPLFRAEELYTWEDREKMDESLLICKVLLNTVIFACLWASY